MVTEIGNRLLMLAFQKQVLIKKKSISSLSLHLHKQEARRTDSEGKTKHGRYGKDQQEEEEEEEIIPCVPGGRSGSPKDKDIPTDLDNFHGDRTFTTRCTPLRLFRVVSALSDVQKKAVNDISFGNILLIPSGRLRRGLCLWLVQNFDVVSRSLCIHGKTIILDSCTFADIMNVPNRGQSIPMDGEYPSVSEWASKFSVSGCGICINHLERRLLDMTSAGTEFKITFCVFLLGSLLTPGNSNFVSADFIALLTNVAVIPYMDWSTWCFNVLCDGIDKFKKRGKSLKTRCVIGCLFVLQLIYLDSFQLDPPIIDKSVPRIKSWTSDKIRTFFRRLQTAGGLHSTEVAIAQYVRNASRSGQHPAGAPSLALNSFVNLLTDATTIKGPCGHDHVFQTLLVEIQSVRDEVTALRTKVTELMCKFNNLMDTVFKRTMKGDKGKQHVDDIDTTSYYADLRSTDVSVDIGCLNQSSHPIILPPQAQPGVDTAENMQSGVLNVSSSDRTLAQANEDLKVPSVCEVDEVCTCLSLFTILTITSLVHIPFNTMGHVHMTDARQSPNNEGRTYQYRRFEISFRLAPPDDVIIPYIFDTDLPYDETIFECDDLVIERKVYRSLQPRQFVCDEVIDVAAHLLYINHQSNNSPTGPSIWFLPTYFEYLALTCKDLSTKSLKVIMGKFKETHMPNFKNYDSIFIPVNDLRRHWYMVLVKCETGIVEVWDSFPPRRGLDKRHTYKFMTSLDIVLTRDIAAASTQEFCFATLLVKLNECAPRQANGYDYGLFVYMFMRQSYPQTADMKEPSLFPNQRMHIDVAPLPMVKHNTKIQEYQPIHFPCQRIPMAVFVHDKIFETVYSGKMHRSYGKCKTRII
ncbi:hypothetical protein ACOSQ2_019519 [Xanthoceras sorbifolium]